LKKRRKPVKVKKAQTGDLRETADGTLKKKNPNDCKHERLGYAGSDYDSQGNRCNIQECLDCGEVFMVKMPHP
jgi:hypothetical protein